MTPFMEWFRGELDRRHMTYADAGNVLGLNPNTPRLWALGLSVPARRQVNTLARAFDADVERLYRLLGWLPAQDPNLSEPIYRLTNKLGAYPLEVQLAAEELVDVFLAHCAGK